TGSEQKTHFRGESVSADLRRRKSNQFQNPIESPAAELVVKSTDLPRSIGGRHRSVRRTNDDPTLAASYRARGGRQSKSLSRWTAKMFAAARGSPSRAAGAASVATVPAA